MSRLFVALLAMCVCIVAQHADAHPFGMASVNRYIGVECMARGGLRIAWLLDFAELPAAREIARLDRDRDGAVTPAEREAYLDELVPPLVAEWVIERDGVRVQPRPVHRAIEVNEGQSGLNTLRVLAEFAVDPPRQSNRRVTVRVVDRTFLDRPGFRDLRADDSEDARLVSAPEPPPVTAPDGTTLRRVDESTFVFELRVQPTFAPVAGTHDHTRARSRAILHTAANLAWILALALGLARRSTDPRVRIVVGVAFAVAVSAAGESRIALALIGAFALTAAVAVRPRVGWFAKRLAIALLWAVAFAGARLLFGAHDVHAQYAALRLGARVAIALVALLPIAATTTLTGLADALSGLRLPAMFVDTSVATARGVTILRDESVRIARARQLRAPNAGLFTRISLFGAYAATLFERGLQRAERAHLAMSLRGFDGRRVPNSRRLGVRDVLTAVLAIAALILASRAT